MLMPTTLTTGDIAIIGYSSDADGKSFSAVLLRDVEAGTAISFTDNGVNSNGTFRSGEGSVTYTAPAAGAAAGTVINFTGLTGTLNPSASGDQITAYQGSTFLFAVDFADGNTSYAGSATSSNTSAIPPGLTFGTTALAFGEDNAAYSGPTTGSKADLLAAIADESNWTTNDSTPVGYATAFTVQGGVTPGTAAVSIGDVSIAEGNSGTKVATFTVTRSDTSGAFTVNYATQNGTATAGSDYQAASGTLTFAAGGPATQTISVTINGDTNSESNETFAVNLTNLQNTTGTATLSDASATGTITNDDLTRIYDIQGAGHRSEMVGQQVVTRGIVTAIDSVGTENGGNNPVGYWIQDATGDGNYRTSDAVFVFLGTGASVTIPAGIAVGAEIQLTATVSEFASGTQLSTTQLNPVGSATVLSVNNALPTAVRIGDVNDLTTGLERKPALVSLGDDDGDATPEAPATFDPVNQGADFWETLEGMRVTLEDVRVTGPFRSNFDEQFVTPNVGENASENDRGGLTIRDTTPGTVQPADKVFDLNPEKIQLDDEAGIALPTGLSTGDRLGDVTGVVNYANSQYEVNVTEAYGPVTKANLQKETTSIVENLDRIRIASFNVENLAPVGQPVDGVATPASKYAGLAAAIVGNLGSPEILALQEVLDNDGATNSSTTSAVGTLSALIQAIVDAGGPRYQAIDSPPIDDTVGGIPGGNQRVAYLFNPNAVTPTARNDLTVASGTPAGITVFEAPTADQIGQGNSDFNATRKSLAIEWSPVGYTDGQGGTFHTINNHLSSKGGSAPLYGTDLNLPLYADPLNGSSQATGTDNEREGQAEALNAYVDGILANGLSSDDRVVVLGDLNDFQFFPVVDLVTGQIVRTQANPDGTPSVFAPGTAVLAELAEKLAPEERYSYNFDGNAQALDHILISNELFDSTLFDIVHINSEFIDQVSDHDPSIASLVMTRSAALATSGNDTFDQASYTAKFGATRGSLQGDDIIDGLGGDDTITAGAGNDLVNGGAGSGDRAVFSGARANYVVETLSATSFRITDSRTGGDGVDTITNVELFQFSDGIRSAAELADAVAPTLASATPADNAGSVARSGSIVLTFNEAVQAGTGTITITNGGNDVRQIAVTDPQVTFSGNTVTINPSADLAYGATYDVIVPAGTIRDAAGNAFSGIAQDQLDFSVENAPAANFTLQILHASDFEAGLDAVDRAGNFAAIVDYLEETRANSITLSSGDNFLPSPFFSAGSDAALKEVYETALEDYYNLAPGTLNISPGFGTADISMLNIIGVEASAIGNHEFDAGTNPLAAIIRQTAGYPGAQFPYLSANLDFSGDANLRGLYTNQIRNVEDYTGFPPAAGIGTKIAPAAIINENGERIGIVGATTQIVQSISSTGGVEVIGPNEDNMAALAAVLQPTIDALIAQGINKIILVSHLQQLALEKALAPLLHGVDIIVAGGSHTLMADGEDVGRGLQPGDSVAESYPFVTQNADGKSTVIVNTDSEYSYVGRLVVEFDQNGDIVADSIDPTVSGAYATTDQGVQDLYATPIDIDGDGDLDSDPFVSGSRGDLVRDIAEGVGAVIDQQDGNIFGRTEVYLEGRRGEVRTEETNLGNLSSDANLWYAQQVDETVLVSIKNGGGLRDSIGTINPDPSNPQELPPAGNPDVGKQDGEISQLDIANSLRFNNALSLVTLTPQQLLEVLEHAVRATAPGATPGQFAQIGGIAYSFDDDLPAGQRVVSAALIDENGQATRVIVQDGEVVADAPAAIRLVTLSFLLTGGDGYPFQSFIAANPSFANVVNLDTGTGVDNAAGRTGDATFVDEGTEQDALAEYLSAFFSDTPYTAADTTTAGDTRIQNLDYRADTVLAGLGDQVLVGDGGNNVLTGGMGDDTIGGLAGNDTLDGRGGDDSLSGDDGDDILRGGAGDDLLIGGAGNDLLSGGEGDDALDGGAGIDTADYSDDTAGIVVNLLNGTASGNAAGPDELAGIENVVGGSGSDVMTGDQAANRLDGGAGNDTLNGGAGDDVILAGAGDDLIDGGEGFDTLDLSAATGPVTVEFTAGRVSGAGIGSDRFTNVEKLLFGAGNDTVTGGNGADAFDGGAGNDTLSGGAGSDRLWGGEGDDALDGGSGDDSLIGGLGLDAIRAGSGNDVIDAGEGNDLVDAGSGSDIVTAGIGNDVVDGGSGDDRLVGGAGDDALTGGSGHDVFVFAAGFGRDTIGDFKTSGSSSDVLEFSTDVFTDYNDAIGSATQVGADVLFTVDSETSLMLQNVQLASLQADEFRFV
jgi:2',3'-cyclic-nucleotide 2'-phosphodiesterase (5'-nucleotidase family)/predicted extracellular nuclease